MKLILTLQLYEIKQTEVTVTFCTKFLHTTTGVFVYYRNMHNSICTKYISLNIFLVDTSKYCVYAMY